MCQFCFDESNRPFASASAYEAFKVVLNDKLQQPNGLHYSGKEPENKEDNFKVYTCANCKTVWWLSVPDGIEDKGFFIRESDFMNYMKRQTLMNKLSVWIFIITIVTIIIILLVFQK